MSKSTKKVIEHALYLAAAQLVGVGVTVASDPTFRHLLDNHTEAVALLPVVVTVLSTLGKSLRVKAKVGAAENPDGGDAVVS